MKRGEKLVEHLRSNTELSRSGVDLSVSLSLSHSLVGRKVWPASLLFFGRKETEQGGREKRAENREEEEKKKEKRKRRLRSRRRRRRRRE